MVFWLGDCCGLFKLIVFGFIVLIVCSLGMYCVGGKWVFFVLMVLISVGVMLVVLYMVVVFLKMDFSGRSIVICVLVINLGLVVGFVIVGMVFSVVGLCVVGWFFVGLLVVLILLISVVIWEFKLRDFEVVVV